MSAIAVEIRLDHFVMCDESYTLTTEGYQIFTGNEMFFVSRDVFKDKYRSTVYETPLRFGRMLTFDEALDLLGAITLSDSHYYNRTAKKKAAGGATLMNAARKGDGVCYTYKDGSRIWIGLDRGAREASTYGMSYAIRVGGYDLRVYSYENRV